MGTTKRICVCVAAALLLAACSSMKRELPDNDKDKTLKSSPCACAGIEDYDGGGFEWRRT